MPGANQSPTIGQKYHLIKQDVKVDGETIKSNFTIASINIYKKLNKITTAQVTIHDGDISNQEFRFKDETISKLIPGKTLEILVGYEEDGYETIFKGIITNIGTKTRAEQAGLFVIEGADEYIRLTEEKINKVYKNKKDSEIVKELCDKYQLQNQIQATQYQHKEITQYYCTAWDFIITRAQMNERVVKVEKNKLFFIEPDSTGQAPIELEYGKDFHKMSLEVDGMSQLKKVKTSSWDPNTHKVVERTSSEPSVPEQGSQAQHGEITNNFNKKDLVLHAPGQVTSQELGAWADSQLLISRLSRIKGSILFQGYNDIDIDQKIKIKATGELFDGDAYISAIHHHVEDSNFTTEIFVGLDNTLYAQERSQEMDMDGNGIIPGISGLTIGKVINNVDPDGEYRVQVNIPMIPQSQIWARLSKFWGSSDHGSFFIPQVGDEVFLDFLGGDPRYPVIMGSVYSKKNKPHYTPDNENSIQAITTKNELKFILEDKDKNIILETPGSRRQTLSDQREEVIFEDPFNNKITMKNNGIFIDTPKDLEIKAQGKVLIEGSQGITIDSKTSNTDINAMAFKAKAKVSAAVEGVNVTLKAKASASLDGGIMSLKAKTAGTFNGGITTKIGGGMVLIN